MFKQSPTQFHRFVAACCLTLAVLCHSALQAQEFKPFLSLQTVSPDALINVGESVAALLSPENAAEMRMQMAPYKNMPGVSAVGTIGLALQVNEESDLFGLDAVIVLPINDLSSFNIPGLEMGLMAFKAMLGTPVGGKYTFVSPLGSNTVAFQKPDYIIIATESAADFAENADPRTLFAELEGSTLGVTVSPENISKQDVEMILEMLAFPLAIMGMGFDPDEIMMMFEEGVAEALGAGQMQLLAETASISLGFTLAPNTLDLTVSMLQIPRKDSALADKILQVKNARTNFGGFLQDTVKTIFSFSQLDYLTDAEIEELETAAELISEDFIGGLLESVADDEGAEAALLFADALLRWVDSSLDYFDENRLIDVAMSFDSDGILLYAQAIDPAVMADLVEQLLPLLPLAVEDGELLLEFMDGKIDWDYDTVADYSLSGLPDIFADLPADLLGGLLGDLSVSDVLTLLPWSLYWAVKGDEAVAMAVGFDASQTEAALKTALTASATPVPPRHTALMALKPLGQFLQTHLLPLLESQGLPDAAEVRAAAAKLATLDAGAQMVITSEFPNEAYALKYQVDGRFFSALFELLRKP